MTISIQKLSAVALVISGASLAACNVDTTGSGATDAATQELSADGNEAVASNVQQASFGELAFSVTQSDPTLAAEEALAPTTKMFSGGCATRTKDPTNPKVVHIHFTDCTGPFGLRHLSGDETAVFSENADKTLHVALSDDGNLTVNGRSVQHSGAGDITVSGTTRNVAWKGAWTRENDKGLTVSHTTDKTILVDTNTGCRTSNGSGVTLVGPREIDTKIDNLVVCKNASGEEGCPSGTVTHTAKKSGQSVTVDFDGTATAAVTGRNGQTVDVALVCTP